MNFSGASVPSAMPVRNGCARIASKDGVMRSHRSAVKPVRAPVGVVTDMRRSPGRSGTRRAWRAPRPRVVRLGAARAGVGRVVVAVERGVVRRRAEGLAVLVLEDPLLVQPL